jgi:hypothetical protein
MEPGPWNWLEIAKLAAGLLTPAAIGVGGIYIHRITKQFEHTQWRGQKLIEKRLAIYDEMAPKLNDILCYFTYVGSWRDFTPSDIVQLKRASDKTFHLAAPLLSNEFFEAYKAWQECCFETYTGWGEDPKLRTLYVRRREARADSWETEWNTRFSDKPTPPEEIRTAYKRVMDAFAHDIGVNSSPVVPLSGAVPANVE